MDEAPLAPISQWLAVITGSKWLGDLSAHVYELCARMDLSAAAGGMLTGPKSASSDLFYFNNWPASWLEVYRANHLQGRDPIVRWALGSGAPISWSNLRAKLAPDDLGHALFDLAAAHGYTEGYVVPVRTMAGHLGLVSVGGNRTALAQSEENLLHTVCTAALNQAERLAHPLADEVIKVLTPRERDCVALLVDGLAEADIAAALGIAPPTARFHLDNARLKMRASSRAHLALLMTGMMHKFLRAPRIDRCPRPALWLSIILRRVKCRSLVRTTSELPDTCTSTELDIPITWHDATT